MVLVLKHRKSRSSPGTKAGGCAGMGPAKVLLWWVPDKPIHSFKSRCRCTPSGGFCVSGLSAGGESAIEVRSTSQGRPAARANAREAKLTDVGAGA